MARTNQEIAENSVATVIDFASIMLAYNLGVSQLGVAIGIAYAAFDAFIVIWLRKRLTNGIRIIFGSLFLNRLADPSETVVGGGELEVGRPID